MDTSGAVCWSSTAARNVKVGRVRVASSAAGDVTGGRPVVVRGIESIDVTNAGTSFFSTNHTTFADCEGLVDDMRSLFETGKHPPSARAPVFKPMGSGGGMWWQYRR